MTFSNKVKSLSSIIDQGLPALIGKKCVFLDLAYYENIGDVLIWEGTEWFLRKNRIKCIYKASKDTFDWRPIPADTTIILQGGGNFGDVWLPHQEFRLKVIDHYQENKIVILPQTVFYGSIEVLKKEADLMSMHRKLTICARDKVTEKLLRDNFKNDIVLLPDMAFCIPKMRISRFLKPVASGKNLFLKRCDKELSSCDYHRFVPREVDQHDWPTYEKISGIHRFYLKLFSRRYTFSRLRLVKIVDWFAQYILRPHFVNTGIRFLSKYDYVYTTRLHVAILSVLLDKPFTFFDNSYGKNSSFFDTWLSDADGVRFIRR